MLLPSGVLKRRVQGGHEPGKEIPALSPPAQCNLLLARTLHSDSGAFLEAGTGCRAGQVPGTPGELTLLGLWQ